jgi:TonB family protein
VILTILAGYLPALAQGVEDQIKARLIGQPLFLRGCWGDDKLKFDADGQPQSDYKIVSFTESAIDVRSVKVSGDRLQIVGQRVGLEFLNGNPQRIDIKGKGYDGRITIEIRGVSDGDFGKVLDAIFAPDVASLQPTLPDYWRGYVAKHLSGSSADADDPPGPGARSAIKGAGQQLRVGGAVTRPVVLYSAEPDFTETARLSKFSGNVMVYLWVLEDGSTSHLRIVRPAGLGLDEKAIEAVSKYQFKPATKNGVPVVVELFVDVNFNIF